MFLSCWTADQSSEHWHPAPPEGCIKQVAYMLSLRAQNRLQLCYRTTMSCGLAISAAGWAAAPHQRPAAWPAASSASCPPRRRARCTAAEASASRGLPPVTYRHAAGGGVVGTCGTRATAMQLGRQW